MKRKSIFVVVIVLIFMIIIKTISDNNVRNFINNINNDHMLLAGVQTLYEIKNNRIFVDNEYKNSGNLIGISDGYIFFDEKNNSKIEFFYNGWCYRKEYANDKFVSSLGDCKRRNYLYRNTNSTQIFIAQQSGYYRLETWGASGGISAYFKKNELLKTKVGKGAYSAGTIFLEKGEIVYVQVGGKGDAAEVVKDLQRFTNFGYPSKGGLGGYNGGGTGFDDPESNAGGGGGGASDIRLIGGKWDDFDSLKSRIVVAGGGGGMSRYYEYKGNPNAGTGASGSGGTISGKDGKVQLSADDFHGHGSTQSEGYKFGVGENGNLCMTTINGLGGGAGGYYGSNSARCNPNSWVPSTGAGGGSSYVSGCDGCKSIEEKSTKNSIKMNNNAIHYSNKIFDDIVMIDGDSKMPNPTNGKTMIGNNGDGFVRISYLGQWR